MFSGIIESQAHIISRENGLFTMENPFEEDLKEGQSIAHDGACMTILNVSRERYSFFAMTETLEVTNFSGKCVGNFFNVERALKLGERLDGHMVSGHIDTIGEIIERNVYPDDSLELCIAFSSLWRKYVIYKGSIAVNGVSLTITQIRDSEDRTVISISLIPYTQKMTNL
jgi:riboflavin synthase